MKNASFQLPNNKHLAYNIQHNTTYDYIITGAGCAGLSLLMRMMQEPFFGDKQILVIDDGKTSSRTWCFWEKEEGLFEPMVSHAWGQIEICAPSFSRRLALSPYTYKMIRSNHLDQYVRILAQSFSNIHWRQGKVEQIGNEGDRAFAVVNGERIYGRLLFNSMRPDKQAPQQGKHYLVQHFLGWTIETARPVFDPGVARFMDFRTTQEYGTAFLYVLPVTAQRALIEFTVFSPHVIAKELYENALMEYIGQVLCIEEYGIAEIEAGGIPMTNHHFQPQEANIIHIGTAGGDTKGSTGYSFQFIQKRAQKIVTALTRRETPVVTKGWWEHRFDLYDSTLLRVLVQQKLTGEQVFTRLFRKNSAPSVLSFLDNETSLVAELPIFASLPASVFLPAFLRECFLH